MSHAILKSWIMLAWLAGLAAILLIDAFRKLIREDTATPLPKPQHVERAVDLRKKDARITDLFDRPAEEPLHPESRRGLALRDQRAVLQEYEKSA